MKHRVPNCVHAMNLVLASIIITAINNISNISSEKYDLKYNFLIVHRLKFINLTKAIHHVTFTLFLTQIYEKNIQTPKILT